MPCFQQQLYHSSIRLKAEFWRLDLGYTKVMKLSDDLVWRGLIKDKTFADGAWLDEPRTFYHGYDASMPSLTVGNLAALFLDKRLMDAGWKPVILMGGGTSLVGDPGGKTEERILQNTEDVAKNIAAIKDQVANLFEGESFELVNNHDWLKDLNFLDFLRDIGKHFSMSELMQREFVTERLDTGISYAEFSYSLLQGYDFWHLFKNHKTVLQVGGSDQWGNMLSGVALVRKKEGQEVQALSHPLVVDKSTGVKFGKSEVGAIWLDPKLTSPTLFYQFWMNAADDDVEEYLKIFTFLSRSEIEELLAAHRQDPGKRLAQTKLAETITKMVHGSGGGEASQIVTKFLTGNKPIDEATPDELRQIAEEIPAVSAKAGDSLIELLVNSGLAESKTEARRLLADNAIYVNGHQVNSELLAAADIDKGVALIRRGKAYKDSALIEQSK